MSIDECYSLLASKAREARDAVGFHYYQSLLRISTPPPEATVTDACGSVAAVELAEIGEDTYVGLWSHDPLLESETQLYLTVQQVVDLSKALLAAGEAINNKKKES